MQIIRDEEMGGIMMIPLFVDWKVRRCNIRDCPNKPSTIIAGTEAGVFGLCEEHYQQFKEEGERQEQSNLDLVFDNYDAFKAEELKEGGEYECVTGEDGGGGRKNR